MSQNTWFQDGPPSSYKIQIMVVDIPQHLRLDKKPVDTPFRFRNFEEASQTAQEMFSGYETRVVSSKDQPHWQRPEKQMSRSDMNENSWYDVYGVTPAYQVKYRQQKNQQLQRSENEKVFQDLSKIKPMAPGFPLSVRPSQEPQRAQKSQKSQKAQKQQTSQKSQKQQKSQKAQTSQKAQKAQKPQGQEQ